VRSSWWRSVVAGACLLQAWGSVTHSAWRGQSPDRTVGKPHPGGARRVAEPRILPSEVPLGAAHYQGYVALLSPSHVTKHILLPLRHILLWLW
jgi:hypothetical protein